MSELVTDRTPRDDGFSMPAEWAPHEATLIAWPTRSRDDLWGDLFAGGQREYANVYLANGAAIVPGGTPADEVAREQVAATFPDREIVQVPARVLHEGGGGPHCIAQQISLS